MSLLPIVIVAAGSLAMCEAKERTASLVVLPPLVLGYDELYNDSGDNETSTKDEEVKKKPPAKEPQRTVIDTKGRRSFRRKVLKERRKPKPLWPVRSHYARVPMKRQNRRQYLIGPLEPYH